MFGLVVSWVSHMSCFFFSQSILSLDLFIQLSSLRPLFYPFLGRQDGALSSARGEDGAEPRTTRTLARSGVPWEPRRSRRSELRWQL